MMEYNAAIKRKKMWIDATTFMKPKKHYAK